MELKGILIKKLPVKSGATKAGGEWKNQEFVIEHQGGQYPKQACITASSKSMEYLDKFKEGDTITVEFDIACREYQDKFYNSLTAWKISGEVSTAAPDPILPKSTPEDFAF